jgi:hypothetical protein|nr:MAG TPA: bifunctional protein PutA [Caudoviricetes sp.]
MATKNVNITLEETLFEEFKDCCKNSYGLPLSIITEGLMKDFCDGEYDVIINKKGVSLRRHEDEDNEKAN